MRIGTVKLKNKTVFAPLAGITNLPMRLLAKEEGCALVCSEMISAKGLVMNSDKTYKMLQSHIDEKPLSVQIFGSEPRVMAEAAKVVEDSGADILDINFGCSVRKVLKTGSGSALMKSPLLADAILHAVRKSISIPLTIKIRSGWDSSGHQAVEISKIAQDNGADAITVHPRTAKQAFSGKSDWSLIRNVKETLTIPVIGNGDITGPEDALRMLDETGCDAIMVGRAAFGRPWIFSQIIAVLEGKEPSDITYLKRFDTMRRFLDASVDFFGETQACFMMRSRLGWFSKGLPHSTKFRESIKRIRSRLEATTLIKDYQNAVETSLAMKSEVRSQNPAHSE